MQKNKVEIEWYDTQTFHDWLEDEEIDRRLKEPMVVTSIGYLYSETKEYVAIVQSISLESKDGILQIPRRSIKSIKRIK